MRLTPLALALLACASRLDAQSCLPADPALLALWRGDGNALDATGAHAGALAGGATYAPGADLQAFALDGVDDHVIVADDPAWTLAGDFTLVAWVRFDRLEPDELYPLIVHEDEVTGAGWAFVAFNRQLEFLVDQGAGMAWVAGGRLTTAPGAWVHLAMRRKGSTYAVFVDGYPMSVRDSGAVVPDAAGPLALGRAGTSFLPGRLDEVAVFSRALSNAEIAALAGAGVCREARDRITVGEGEAFPGGTVAIPVYARDVAGTALGVDRPAGERIQGFLVKVSYAPAAAVASVAAARAGIAATLTPLMAVETPSGSSIAYLASFAEATSPIPFTLDRAAPGDQIASLTFTLAPGAAAGTVVELHLEADVTNLVNQAGTIAERATGGELELGDGRILVTSRAARNLVATAVAADRMRLRWEDPDAGETSFRAEVSGDGATWVAGATVGSDVEEVELAGLEAATPYHVRVVGVGPGGDLPPSNRAFAVTHAAAPLAVCATDVGRIHDGMTADWIHDLATDGARAVATWCKRPSPSSSRQVYLTFVDPAAAAPSGAHVQGTAGARVAGSSVPLVWIGDRFGLHTTRAVVAPTGATFWRGFLDLLTADGAPIARDRLAFETTDGWIWDGRGNLGFHGDGWGLVRMEARGVSDLVYRRADADGVAQGAIVPLAAAADAGEYTAGDPDWNGSSYGLLYYRQGPTSNDVLFQRFARDGAPIGGAVLLWSNPPDLVIEGFDMAWDGAHWVAAWSADQGNPADPVAWVYLQKIDAAGTPVGSPARLSDLTDPAFPAEQAVPVYDLQPVVVPLPGGGYHVACWSYLGETFNFETTLLRADASGAKVGSRTVLSASDAWRSSYPRAVQAGGVTVVTWADSHGGAPDLYAVSLGAAGQVLSGPNPLGTGFEAIAAGANQRVARLGSGFVGVWTDGPPGAPAATPWAWFWDGTGAVSVRREPLVAVSALGAPAVVSLGDGLAMAWKDGAGGLRFDRFDAAGASLLGAATLATSTMGTAGVGLDYSGEAYGAAWVNRPETLFQRVGDDGGQLGAPVVLARGVNQPPAVRWVGSGWAVAWRSADATAVEVALLSPDGTPLGAPVRVAGPGTVAAYALEWNGEVLGVGVSRSNAGADDGVYFAALGPTGAVVTAPVRVAAEQGPSLASYWDGARFRLVWRRILHSPSVRAVMEAGVAPDGSGVTAPRLLAPGGSSFGVAWDGATLGVLAANVSAYAGEMAFFTTACLDDATPPPCPVAAGSVAGGRVAVSWSPVADAESGVARYYLYRDGVPWEMFPPDSTAGVASEYGLPGPHSYELRAANRAWRESSGCPAFLGSGLCGDANGDGWVDVADVFYLIAWALAGGPAPAADCDANGDGARDVIDIFYLVNYALGGGEAPRC